jgi:hypothetical protein
MSLSRREVRSLQAAGWTVVEFSPWSRLRRLLGLEARPVLHAPARRWSR